MTTDRSYLIPEQRLDRNGRTITRWVKQEPKPSLPPVAPAPSLNTKPYTQKLVTSRRETIQGITGGTLGGSIMEHWVGKLDKARLTALDESLAVCENISSDPSVIREQEVIRPILESLARGSLVEDEVAAEALVLRAAFCSDWSQQNEPTTRSAEMKSYIYGIRDDGNLPLGTNTQVHGLTAAVRFAYEMTARFPDAEFLPTEKTRGYAGFTSVVVSYQKYKDPALFNLISAHPEDTGRLIDLAAKYQTCDAQVLRGLYEDTEGSASLSKGWL